MLKDRTKEKVVGLASSTLICSIHHRRSPLFEEGMRRLDEVGFSRIWILDSGINAWGKYQGPYEKWIDIGLNNFIDSLSVLNKMDLPSDIERIVLLDNDCFIFDSVDTLEYVGAFEEDCYDIVTLYSSRFDLTKGCRDIIIPYDLSEVGPRLQPSAIAYSIFRKALWKRVTNPESWFKPPANAVWTRFAGLNPKFGVHRIIDDAEIRKFLIRHKGKEYSQFEKGRWFHMGNLMNSYFQIERGKDFVLCDLHKAYFSKYFPGRISYSDEERKGYLKLWDGFMGLVAGKED